MGLHCCKKCCNCAARSLVGQWWPVVAGAGPAWSLLPRFCWWQPSPLDALLLPPSFAAVQGPSFLKLLSYNLAFPNALLVLHLRL